MKKYFIVQIKYFINKNLFCKSIYFYMQINIFIVNKDIFIVNKYILLSVNMLIIEQLPLI